MNAARSGQARRGDRARVMITPEGIALPLTLASRGSRAGALFLDLAIVGLIMILTTIALVLIAGGVAAFAMKVGGGPTESAFEFVLILWNMAMFLFRNAYFLFFELGARGATPGKRMAGIRIAARDGGRLTADMVIARNLLRDIELFLPFVFLASASAGSDGDMGLAGIAAAVWFLIFALFIFFNADRLRAGDLIAGTWVVEAPKRTLAAAMSGRSAGDEAGGTDGGAELRFTDAELAVYGEYELQTLERVLRENRRESLEPVYQAICAKIGRPVGDVDERVFLEAYYRQLRARLESAMRMGKRKADKFSEHA